jgi:3,4-dihydroxy 2-butanone 4-phosphate synthase/GTP cyclohydrolase II
VLKVNRVEDALEDIRRGRIVIVVDDEDRENEGDFTVAAEKITAAKVNFMAKHGRGLICLALTPERVDRLRLPQMVDENTSKYGTAFTVSIEARRGVTTGISAADRATTILTAINAKTSHTDLVRPGHVFPLRARPGGVLERAGQTEASVDLARLAGLSPAGVICEIMNEDGTMARGPELQEVSRTHGLKVVSVADIIEFRLRNETFVHPRAEGVLRTRYGNFRALIFENSLDGMHHVALVKGEILPDQLTLVRVQKQATLGDVFHSLENDSGEKLHAALRIIEDAGHGVFIYLRQEGTGLILAEEMQSLAQEAAAEKGRPAPSKASTGLDLRLYGIGAQMLRHVGARKIRLLTDHPRKIIGLQGFGITVVEQVPLGVEK